MKFTHIFFDLDRTLWDFESNSQVVLTELYTDLKLDRYTEHYLQFYSKYKKINKMLWEAYGKNQISKEELRDQRFIQTFNELGINDVNLAKEMAQGYIDKSPNQKQLFPNTIETLEDLKNKGYQLNVITNGFKEVQHHKINNCGLSPYFDEIICSEEVGVSKPDRRVFDFSMERTKADKNSSVMIGDDIKADVIGAESAGMSAILFDPNTKKRYDKSMNRVVDLSEIPLLLLKL